MQEISSVESIGISSLTSSIIINEVKLKVDDFNYTLLQKGVEEKTYFNLMGKYFTGQKDKKLASTDTKEWFKWLIVIYYLAEYHLSFLLCYVRFKTTNYKKSHEEYYAISEECGLIASTLLDVIKAFQEVFDEEFKIYDDNDLKKKIALEEGLPLQTYDIESLLQNNITNIEQLNRVMNNLKKLIRALVHIHMKIDDYIESNYLLPTNSESALAECYAVIKFLLLDDLNILRQFFKHLPFDENVISFPISDITDDSHLSISKEENFIWRKGTNVKKLDDKMDALSFLSHCEGLRNEMIYYVTEEIESIHPINTPRNYRLQEMNF